MRVHALALLPLFAMNNASCSGQGKDIVEDVFTKGDFVPHVLTDAQIVKRYGEGLVRRKSSEIGRIYSSSSCNKWLELSVETESSPEFRIVQEISVVSGKPPSEASAYSGQLCSLKLSGVAIGDNREHVVKKFGGRFVREMLAELNGEKVNEIYVNPRKGQSDLYYRFYLNKGHVIAMSIGVTE